MRHQGTSRYSCPAVGSFIKGRVLAEAYLSYTKTLDIHGKKHGRGVYPGMVNRVDHCTLRGGIAEMAEALAPEYESDRNCPYTCRQEINCPKTPKSTKTKNNNKLVRPDANAPEPRHKIFVVFRNIA